MQLQHFRSCISSMFNHILYKKKLHTILCSINPLVNYTFQIEYRDGSNNSSLDYVVTWNFDYNHILTWVYVHV